MKKFLITILTLTVGALSFALELAGVKVDESMDIDGKNLVLNGAGVRKKAFFDLYVGSLYLPGKSADEKEIISSNEPMAIKLNIVSGLVGSKEMKEAVDEGFKNSVPASELPKLAGRIEKFTAAFSKEEIKKGDVFDFIAHKGTVTALKNGKEVERVEGEDFKSGLFGIWLGAVPADKNLKKGLLGSK